MVGFNRIFMANQGNCRDYKPRGPFRGFSER
jgi:hypothetical protein